MLEKYVDDSEPKKVRRSLLTAALFTLFIANIQVISGEMSILGLRVIVEKERLIAFGQISSGIFVFVFIVRSLTAMIQAAEELAQKRLVRSRSIDMANLRAFWGRDAPGKPEDGPDGEADEIDQNYEFRKSRLENLYSRLTFTASVFTVIILDYGAPVAVGVIAAVNPYALSNQIDWIIAS